MAHDTRYNGWKNRETWNVALWIGNDEGLYHLARECVRENRRTPYALFIERIEDAGNHTTGDGIRWDSRKVNRAELNAMMRELVEDE